MAQRFDSDQWRKIDDQMAADPNGFGLPEPGRAESVVLGSFNIRKLGEATDREKEIQFMARFASRCDLLAVQEVQDDLGGLLALKSEMEKLRGGPDSVGILVSDITGREPGGRGMTERLAFLFRWQRVRRTALASDITLDRTAVVSNFMKNQDLFVAAWRKFSEETAEFNNGLRIKKPKLKLPAFLLFHRAPHCATFDILDGGEQPVVSILAVNGHLTYGTTIREREEEFDALISWLVRRLKNEDVMVAPNIILLADLNLNFDNPENDRREIRETLTALNREVFGDTEIRRIYFPFLDPHPDLEAEFRTNARHSETFDHIALFHGADNPPLPNDQDGDQAGQRGPDGFNYGVFDFMALFAQALHGKSVEDLTDNQRNKLIGKVADSISDHMPIWVRLPT